MLSKKASHIVERFMVIVVIVGLSMFAGYGLGYDKRSDETDKILKASIYVKKLYGDKVIILPEQQYIKKAAMQSET